MLYIQMQMIYLDGFFYNSFLKNLLGFFYKNIKTNKTILTKVCGEIIMPYSREEKQRVDKEILELINKSDLKVVYVKL